MDAKKLKVEMSIETRGRWLGTVELTQIEYEKWCERIDSARGYEEERVAEELLELAGGDLFRDMNIDEIRVDDFIAAKDPT